MGLFGSQVDTLAAHGDVAGLVALLGPLDRTDIKARHALIAMGADAVPALLACALGERAPGTDEEAAGRAAAEARDVVDRRAAAAHTVP